MLVISKADIMALCWWVGVGLSSLLVLPSALLCSVRGRVIPCLICTHALCGPLI